MAIINLKIIILITIILIERPYTGLALPPTRIHPIGPFESFVPRIELFSDVADDVTPPRVARRHAIHGEEYDTRSFCKENSEQPPNRVNTGSRIKALREKMKTAFFDAIIIPSSDEHQNEYVAPSDKRREFITGFSGSAGTAVITENTQVLWTDSRYTFQADQETDCSWNIITRSSYSPSITKWLTTHLLNGSRVGADPRLYGATDWETTQKKLFESNITLEESDKLLDQVWEKFERPPSSNGFIFVHDLQYAGIHWQDKIRSIREDMTKDGGDLLVVTALDEIAWLLNLRGSDIPYNPVFRSYLILEASKSSLIHLFLSNPDTLDEKVKRHLDLDSCGEAGMCIVIHPYNSVKDFLESIAQREDIKKVFMSKQHPYSTGVSYYIYSTVPEEKRVLQPSPIMLRKSKKLGIEGNSMKEAQIKDSVALVEFFAFLEKEIRNGANWDEISVLTPLKGFRGEQTNYRGDSFKAISAFGSNSALAHYVPSNQTKKNITDQSFYMLDSGGQYLEGTTDVTRTMHFGEPSPFQKEAYTRVLQGNIDLATLIFPTHTKDSLIDIIPRRPLLDGGLNYGHGTGHGIGLYLSIHEGPTLIAMSDKRSSTIEVGQFFSDEPGYYQKNSFGIRLENIVRVMEHPTFKDSWGYSLLHFETVTLIPYEPKLINENMLTYKQCSFLNSYNKKIEKEIGERLKQKGNMEAYAWMVARTQPIICSVTAKAVSFKPPKALLLTLILKFFICKVLLH